MEKLLTSLFDFQRFSQNPVLNMFIAETEMRYGCTTLSEDDLNEVWAAGEPILRQDSEKKYE